MILFRLKKEWFDKIKSGIKTHEYRLYKDYWRSRIANEIVRSGEGINFDIKFVCGYQDKDPSKVLYARVVDINIINGEFTDLKVKGQVFDIEFVLIDRGAVWGK